MRRDHGNVDSLFQKSARVRNMLEHQPVRATSAASMNAAERYMTQLLRQRHHLPEFMDNDFDIRNLTAVANAAARTSRVMTLMLGAIASISLVVGGIGIMNIMLVSVTERTRKIG